MANKCSACGKDKGEGYWGACQHCGLFPLADQNPKKNLSTFLDNEVMCQGHKCYKMIKANEIRSPYSINVPLCFTCYKKLMVEMFEEYTEDP